MHVQQHRLTLIKKITNNKICTRWLINTRTKCQSSRNFIEFKCDRVPWNAVSVCISPFMVPILFLRHTKYFDLYWLFDRIEHTLLTIFCCSLVNFNFETPIWSPQRFIYFKFKVRKFVVVFFIPCRIEMVAFLALFSPPVAIDFRARFLCLFLYTEIDVRSNTVSNDKWNEFRLYIYFCLALDRTYHIRRRAPYSTSTKLMNEIHLIKSRKLDKPFSHLIEIARNVCVRCGEPVCICLNAHVWKISISLEYYCCCYWRKPQKLCLCFEEQR